MGIGSLTDYAHQAKLIQELEANGTNLDEYFKNRTEEDMGNSDTRERHHHHHYNTGYYGGGFGYRPSWSSMFLGNFRF